MQAIRAHEYGGPDVLVLEQVPIPRPEANQVLVKVMAAGVNPADWKYRSGNLRQFMPLTFPWTPGLEGAGVIEALGSNVTVFKPGQQVYGVFGGAYAEYALANVGDLQPLPDGFSFERTAGVPVGALTAWGAVIEAANVQKGQHILVHGAAGGVGQYVVQLARWKGAHVVGTASAGNLDFVRALGAETAFDYKAAPFESLIHNLDAVIDTVGGDLAERSYRVLRLGGVFVTVAGRLAPDAGKAAGVRAVSAGRAKAENLLQISDLLQSNQLRPLVGKVFPLAQAGQAQELSQSGHGRGRIILKIQ
jgi:NADPH:quinone reductase-like Zn-dependent oxidoreductase